jgi:hypothetical protein
MGLGWVSDTLGGKNQGNWLALVLIFVAARSIMEVFSGSDQGDKYVVILLTALLSITYALLRVSGFFTEPGFRMPYIVRIFNVIFIMLILLGMYQYQQYLGKMLTIICLLAIEINLISLYVTYTSKDRQWWKPKKVKPLKKDDIMRRMKRY